MASETLYLQLNPTAKQRYLKAKDGKMPKDSLDKLNSRRQLLGLKIYSNLDTEIEMEKETMKFVDKILFWIGVTGLTVYAIVEGWIVVYEWGWSWQ